MMRSAEALPIGWIEQIAAVSLLNDVISEHAMAWCRLAAPLAVFPYGLAPCASPIYDGLAPCLMLGTEVVGINLLGLHRYGAGVDGLDQGSERLNRSLSAIPHPTKRKRPAPSQ